MTSTRIDAAALFRAHAGFVARFLRRLGFAAADVDDLVQEVFMIAHRKGGYVAGAAQPRTWLAAIAFNVARTARRASAVRAKSHDASSIDHALATEPDPAQALETQRAIDRVQVALATLDVEHRATFILYEIEAESGESIAAALEVPIGTVYSRLHHARKRFLRAHAALDDDTNAPEPRLRRAGVSHS